VIVAVKESLEEKETKEDNYRYLRTLKQTPPYLFAPISILDLFETLLRLLNQELLHMFSRCIKHIMGAMKQHWSTS